MLTRTSLARKLNVSYCNHKNKKMEFLERYLVLKAQAKKALLKGEVRTHIKLLAEIEKLNLFLMPAN